MKITHKFRNKPTTVLGICFASKKEAKHYQDLCLLKDRGEIVFFLRQVPFHLPGNVRYVCDFMVFYEDGTVEVQDVKGIKTDMYILKKKLIEDIYPIEIVEI